jgi:multisubunit Na+/H+ antiporter MnhC subunit
MACAESGATHQASKVTCSTLRACSAGEPLSNVFICTTIVIGISQSGGFFLARDAP